MAAAVRIMTNSGTSTSGFRSGTGAGPFPSTVEPPRTNENGNGMLRAKVQVGRWVTPYRLIAASRDFAENPAVVSPADFGDLVRREALAEHLPHDSVDESASQARPGPAEGGNYATLFVRAVRAQAADYGVAFDLLLGYAAAHEIGHCLLGPGHSYAGLMRARWNRKDAGEISRLSLRLTKEESRKAVARLVLAAPTARRGQP